MSSAKSNNANVVVVIPAFNEASMLPTVARALVEKKYKVIVVDDGSVPSLYPAIKGLHVHYLRHQANLGQGAALQTGFEFARKLNPDFIISFDADGQHDVNSIPSLLLPIIDNKADITLGSRFLNIEKNNIPFSKMFVLQIARAINFLFSGLWLSDAHNGLRAFSKTAVEKINITENRMAHASEILFEIKKQKLKFTEVPVPIYYTEYSKQKGQSSWNSIRIVFDLILHKLFK